MEFVRVRPGMRAPRTGVVVAIGNFDGVHLGHQALVARTCALAAGLDVAPAILTFEPMPLEYLRPQSPPARLMRLRDKALALASLGAQLVAVARFDERLSRLVPAEFERQLARDLNARAVVVGAGFRYGAGRAGTVDGLAAAGRELGYSVEVVEPVLVAGERVSSTRLREALWAGDFATARSLTGRPFCIAGRVGHGQRLGRTLGYPTANIRLDRHRAPLGGIYAVRARVAGVTYPAVASLGTRPTVDGVEPWLETHLFDFVGDLYGQLLCVEFVAKLRDEARFASLEALTEQMHADAAAARRALSTDC
jgi:riboflavin kinase / FMN adenylyltransferase